MRTLVKCGTLFTGTNLDADQGKSILIQDGLVMEVGATEELAARHTDAKVIDYSDYFVMPGICDNHTHLAYGNAKSEEDIDLYAPVEFRALRGLFMAQKTLNAGVTSLCNPGGPSRVGISIRDAVNTGMFDGPRITTTGPYVTSRQGLTDWYPTWVGQPETSIGHLVRNPYEAIEEIRSQVKDGVDAIKIAMEGTLIHSLKEKGTGLVAAFDQEETTRMVKEIHRLGKRAIVHARGREATLYSARAGVDVIMHASWLDDACIEAMLENGSVVCPSLTLLVNNYEFAQPADVASKGWVDWCRNEAEIAFENLGKAHKAGVPILNGSETGFAMTPYGEWHAKEIDIMIRYIGMTPAEALRSATALTGSYMADDGKSGAIAVGSNADFLVVKGNPLEQINHLLDSDRIHAVYLGGKQTSRQDRAVDHRKYSEFTQNMWADLYTRERVADLFPELSLLSKAA
jgi:imidazolonepropionase-like amidohydrolase